MTTVRDSVVSVDTFEQQCVLPKYILQSPRLKGHMKTVDIDKSLINRDYFKHKFLNNTKIYI